MGTAGHADDRYPFNVDVSTTPHLNLSGGTRIALRPATGSASHGGLALRVIVALIGRIVVVALFQAARNGCRNEKGRESLNADRPRRRPPWPVWRSG